MERIQLKLLEIIVQFKFMLSQHLMKQMLPLVKHLEQEQSHVADVPAIS